MNHLLIITGASSGIGAALATVAEAGGATVATMSRRPGPGTYLAIDLADSARWPEAITWMGEQIAGGSYDRVSFVHNAGLLAPIGFAAEVDLAAYQTNVLVNAAAGPVLGAGFLAAMAATPATPGTLIMVSSGAGKNPFPGWSSYCAAKAGFDMWVRVTGLEQQQRDSPVTVASIGPGVVDTGMQELIRTADEQAFPNVERFHDLHASGALASPEAVGLAYWNLVNDGNLRQGTVASVSDLA